MAEIAVRRFEPLALDQRRLKGAFDIVGDVHGCADELELLLAKLGYRVRFDGVGDERRAIIDPPRGRTLVFVGDLVDRGPRTPDVLRLVMSMVHNGTALCVPGNHDAKFARWLKGQSVKPTHGLAATITQFASEPEILRREAEQFFDSLPFHLWLDDGRLAVAHAGIQETMIGETSDRIRRFCLYGDTDGEVDSQGLAIRYNWAAKHSGATMIVYGHVPVVAPAWVNNSVCIDTACCFGNALSALRWPEREIVTVSARAIYYPSKRELGLPSPRP
jgi:hypothetical protein